MTAYTTPSQSYYQQILGEVSQGKALGTQGRGILGSLGGSIAPTIGIAGLQGSAVQSQLGLTGTELNLNNAYQKALAGFTLGQLGIKGSELGIQGTTLAEKTKLNQYENQIEQQQYALTSTRYPEEYAQAALTNRNSLLNLRGANASSGTAASTGAKEQITTLAQQYGFKKETIARSQGLAAMGQQGTLAQQKYSTQQLANAKQNLGLLAQSNGLSEQEVMTRLNYSLSQNQLGAAETVISMLTKLGGIYTGAELSAGNALGLGGFLGGMNLYAPSAMNNVGVATMERRQELTVARENELGGL